MPKLPKKELKKTNNFRLDGETALVTGVLGLLGPVWSRGLLEAGAVIVGLDLPKAPISDDFLLLKKEFGERLVLLRADILKRKTLERALAVCRKKYGIPTILVNNAGI